MSLLGKLCSKNKKESVEVMFLKQALHKLRTDIMRKDHAIPVKECPDNEVILLRNALGKLEKENKRLTEVTAQYELLKLMEGQASNLFTLRPNFGHDLGLLREMVAEFKKKRKKKK